MQQRVGNAVLEFEKKEVRSPSCSSFSADANFTKNFLLCKVIWDWCISPFAEPAGQGKRQSLFPAVGSLRSPAGILLLRGGFPVLWVIELISFLWQSNGHYGHFYLGQKHTLKKRHNPTIDFEEERTIYHLMVHADRPRFRAITQLENWAKKSHFRQKIIYSRIW